MIEIPRHRNSTDPSPRIDPATRLSAADRVTANGRKPTVGRIESKSTEPDCFRPDKVRQMREQIAFGRLRVDPRRIADGMITKTESLVRIATGRNAG